MLCSLIDRYQTFWRNLLFHPKYGSRIFLCLPDHTVPHSRRLYTYYGLCCTMHSVLCFCMRSVSYKTGLKYRAQLNIDWFLMMPSITTKFQYVNSPLFIFLLTKYRTASLNLKSEKKIWHQNTRYQVIMAATDAFAGFCLLICLTDSNELFLVVILVLSYLLVSLVPY
jgi:hypothetical protein